MSRLNALLTLVIVIIFVLLLYFAGQPITPEADLVQRWYNVVCDPSADQSPITELTWRGGLTDLQLHAVIAAYRTLNYFADGCTAIVDHNIIYFQAVPAQLAASVERIKFVAVNVYAPEQPQVPNQVVSIEFGVHVLYDYAGIPKILPHFIPDSPLGIVDSSAPVPLYNNDGLHMGEVQLTGNLRHSQQNGTARIGIPLKLSTIRRWGRYWVRIYANGAELPAEQFADVLPFDEQATFLKAKGDYVPPDSVVSGVVWFASAYDDDIRVTVDAYQTLWDIRSIPIMIRAAN